MKKGTVLFAVTLLAGVVAGYFRALQLVFAFDSETQLLEKHPSTTFLLGIVLVFVAAAVFLAAISQKYEPGETKVPSDIWFIAEFAACAALLFSCVYGLIGLRENFHLVLLIFNVLGIFAALSIIAAAFYTRKGILTASTGFYYTVPIFWCCFALVLDFWSHSANPVPLSFALMMFALIFTALSTHAAAGYFFGRPRRRRCMAYCSLGLFFSILTFVSYIVCPFYGDTSVLIDEASASPDVMAKLVFMMLHLGALFFAVSGNALRKPRPVEAAPDAEGYPGLTGESLDAEAESDNTMDMDADLYGAEEERPDSDNSENE